MESANLFRIVFVTNDSYYNSYQMAKVVVGERLAACCTIIANCISVFEWEGKFEDRSEYILMIKTSVELLPKLEERIREIHSDSVPEIIAVTMDSASAPYLNWMNDVLRIQSNEE